MSPQNMINLFNKYYHNINLVNFFIHASLQLVFIAKGMYGYLLVSYLINCVILYEANSTKRQKALENLTHDIIKQTEVQNDNQKTKQARS